MREAPSIYTVRALVARGATIKAYDPAAMSEARKVIGNQVEYVDDCYKTLDGASALLIMTEWQEFRDPDFALVKSKLKRPLIIDGRNLFEPADMKALGFEYHSIGRRTL
jgi:UDPglucose 6-dehydrogenase